MSGILKKLLRKKKKVAAFGALVLLIILAGCALNIKWYGISVACILYFAAASLNELVRKKAERMSKPFGVYSAIRNVDYLVIGGCCNAKDYVPAECSYVQIAAPGRGYHSSFQILRHTHSILKEEGGTIIIAIGKSRNVFTVFDIPFLHPVTIKKYRLERLCRRSKFPLIFAPIASVKFMFGRGSMYQLLQDVPDELKTFCDERNHKLLCLKEI